MKRLLNIEILKNLHYRPFRILTTLYFIIFIGLLFIGLVDFELLGIPFNLKEQGIYDFPRIWNFTTYIVGFFKIFLGMIIVFSISEEFSNRMYKQNIIDGLSRKEFIVSKLLTISLFTLISTFLVMVITFLLGYSYSENTNSELVFQEFFLIGNYALELFTFFCFLLFLSVLLKKSMFVILALFFWGMAELILNLIAKFIFISDLESTEKTSFIITNLLPWNSVSALIPNPASRLNVAEMLGANAVTLEYPWMAMLACMGWCIVFIGGAYQLLKKRDI